MDLFNRSVKLQIRVSDRQISEIENLRISFKTKSSLSSSGGEADISIWNLNKTTRSLIEESKQGNVIKRIVLLAGYGDDIAEIYSGNLTDRTFKKEAADTILQLLCKDGQNQKGLTINKNYGPGTGLRDIVRDIIKLVRDQSPEPLAVIDEDIINQIPNTKFNNGLNTNGLALEILEEVLQDAGVEWSFQSGALQLMFSDSSLKESIVELTPETGLIGKPEKLEDGRIKIRSFLNARIKPGRRFRVTSDEIDKSVFTAETTEHDGDKRGDAWHTVSEGRPAA